jgi:hypothetical protein
MTIGKITSIIAVLLAIALLVACEVPGGNKTLEETLNENTSKILNVLAIDEPEARAIATKLNELGAGNFTDVSSEGPNKRNVIELTVSDDKGNTYWLALDKYGFIGTICKDSKTGEVLYTPLPE